MVRMARGTAVCGSRASPAVTATTSVPIAEDHEDHRHPYTAPARGQKSAVAVRLERPMAGRGPAPAISADAEHDEQDDGHHLDHGEPILEAAEAAHAARVDVEQPA